MRKDSRRVEAGTILVRTGQPLGSLAAFLLEPQSLDGLATWNFFDAVLKEGQDYPVLRLPAPVPLTSGRVRPLAEDRVLNKPITFEAVFGAEQPLSFAGNPVAGLTWLDDGEHFLQVKEGRLRKVHALSGRSQPMFDTAKVAQALAQQVHERLGEVTAGEVVHAAIAFGLADHGLHLVGAQGAVVQQGGKFAEVSRVGHAQA